MSAFHLAVPQHSVVSVSGGPLAHAAEKRVQKQKGAAIVKDIRSAGDLDYQVKMIPYHALQLDESDHREAVIASDRRLPMVVCASLLDRAPNLGGLTRTCEVMGLEAIAVPDLRVVSNKEFLNTAVTAEKWIKTLEVPPATLAEWLVAMKEKGYALIGLEQSKDSKSLVGFQFPRKCVLLLGGELRGLPGQYLSMLDHVIEIPQRGTIRSLNVHVSASVLISQYVFQNQ